MRVAGLYAITAQHTTLADIEQALTGGVQCLQYRYKQRVGAPDPSVVAALCRRYRATFIINDDVALAHDVAADGVHLGRDDPALGEARARLGNRAIIGVSCYNDVRRAVHAAAAGADYIAFGRFFPSSTKPKALTAPINVLSEARAQVAVPIIAIGGITPENAHPLLAAGADALAVIDGLFGQADIAAAARRYRTLFDD
ncbi:MAG: thiamine phosphate synthase [Gammaproteobacteria bacterium]|nr:thiamine phosphate synthase [Gammaproteobacteria bacterium]